MNPAHAKLVAPLTPHGEALEQIARLSCDLDDLIRENSQLRQKLHELQQRRETFGDLQRRAHLIAKDKGFWQRDFGPETNATKLALIASEVSEALEADRESWEYFAASAAVPRRIMSKKIPGFSTFEEELADVVIRTMDLAERRKLNLGGAIKAKLAFNETRPTRHGKAY